MTIRPAKSNDLDNIYEIDGTVESHDYLHLDHTQEDLFGTWRLEPRPLREKLVLANTIDDELRFTLKQIVLGHDEGTAVVAEHDGQIVALLLAQERPAAATMELLDVRVDYDFRRQGIATVMVLQLIEAAREKSLRAVVSITRTNNGPAAKLLNKLNFHYSGLDTHRYTNHDLVKEQSAVLWHYEL